MQTPESNNGKLKTVSVSDLLVNDYLFLQCTEYREYFLHYNDVSNTYSLKKGWQGACVFPNTATAGNIAEILNYVLILPAEEPITITKQITNILIKRRGQYINKTLSLDTVVVEKVSVHAVFCKYIVSQK